MPCRSRLGRPKPRLWRVHLRMSKCGACRLAPRRSCPACSRHGAMAEAVEAGTAASAEFDVVESLALLIAANVVIGIDGPHAGLAVEAPDVISPAAAASGVAAARGATRRPACVIATRRRCRSPLTVHAARTRLRSRLAHHRKNSRRRTPCPPPLRKRALDVRSTGLSGQTPEWRNRVSTAPDRARWCQVREQ